MQKQRTILVCELGASYLFVFDLKLSLAYFYYTSIYSVKSWGIYDSLLYTSTEGSSQGELLSKRRCPGVLALIWLVTGVTRHVAKPIFA